MIVRKADRDATIKMPLPSFHSTKYKATLTEPPAEPDSPEQPTPVEKRESCSIF